MSAVLITYDLKKPGQNYAALYEAIKSLGTWWHYLDSTWIVSSVGLTVSRASEVCRAKMDASDSLLCLDVTNDAHQGYLEKDAWDWINKYL